MGVSATTVRRWSQRQHKTRDIGEQTILIVPSQELDAKVSFATKFQ